MISDKTTAFTSIDPRILVNVASDDTTSLIAGVGGAVLGAIVTGLISWHLQKQMFNRESQKNEDQKRNSEKATALSIALKLQSITNFNLDVRNQFCELIEQAAKDGHDKMELWQKITPLAGLPSELPNFEFQEISLLLASKNHKIANELIKMQARSNSIIDALRKYSFLKEKTKDLLPSIMNGRVGTSILNEKQMLKLAPLAVECQSLALQIVSNVNEDSETCIKLTKQIENELNSFFGEKYLSSNIDKNKFKPKNIIDEELKAHDQGARSAFRQIKKHIWPEYYDINSIKFIL